MENGLQRYMNEIIELKELHKPKIILLDGMTVVDFNTVQYRFTPSLFKQIQNKIFPELNKKEE